MLVRDNKRPARTAAVSQLDSTGSQLARVVCGNRKDLRAPINSVDSAHKPCDSSTTSTREIAHYLLRAISSSSGGGSRDSSGLTRCKQSEVVSLCCVPSRRANSCGRCVSLAQTTTTTTMRKKHVALRAMTMRISRARCHVADVCCDSKQHPRTNKASGNARADR